MEKINEKLLKVYEQNKEEFIYDFNQIYEKKIATLTFGGVVCDDYYKTNNRILFIGKETNGEFGMPFIEWLREIAFSGILTGYVKQHPKTWYNIGRVVELIQNSAHNSAGIEESLLKSKQELLSNLRYIAFTNLNKGYGFSTSGKKYNQIIKAPSVHKILHQEIEIINPSTIICCGTFYAVKEIMQIPENHELNGHHYIDSFHPAAPKSIQEFLEKIIDQITFSKI